MNRRPPPGRVHVLTDETLQYRFSHLELARLAARGGAEVIQFREKRPWKTEQRVKVARAIADALHDTAARLVVNDHVDVALACAASGVHLGRDDADPRLARERMGPEALIGVTANSLEEARSIARLPADYIGVGPVFGTRSKAGAAPALGPEGLCRIVERVDLPVIAIGNVRADVVGEVLQAGAHGVAVLSAVACSTDPRSATERIAEEVRRWTQERPRRD